MLTRGSNTRGHQRGVNYAGFTRAGLGLGHAARGYIGALEKMGIAVLQMDASELLPGRSESDRGHLSSTVKNGNALHRVNIVHINPDLLNSFRSEVGAGFFRNSYTIGIWAWETECFPDKWHDRFALVDEIWVGGSFMARGISMASPVPVILMPHVVEPDKIEADRERFGLKADNFIFLFSFDFNSSLSRKNPLALIDAFRRAFTPSQPVQLVIKSQNSIFSHHQMVTLREAAGGSNIRFIDECFDDGTQLALTMSCDAFVSLHRAEGFGLGIAEAMAMGKPVIATGWSGNMDYMNVCNSLPVKFQLAPLEKTDPPYLKGSLWALPDIDDAAGKMRLVYENRETALEIGRAASEYMARFHSRSAIGNRVEGRLGLILDGRISSLRSHQRVLPSDFATTRKNMRSRVLIRLCSGLLKVLPGGMGSVRRKLCDTRDRAVSSL